mgnify:CR=1 FL=1
MPVIITYISNPIFFQNSCDFIEKHLLVPYMFKNRKTINYILALIFNIFSMTLAGRQIHQLTNVVGGSFNPTMAADGTLFFSSYGPGGYPPIINAGDVSNKGWEFEVAYKSDVKNLLQTNLSFNFTSINISINPIKFPRRDICFSIKNLKGVHY